MLGRNHEPPVPVRNRELESLATGVELTLASVLQGIPLATLVPRVVELILANDLARLLYAPASLLIIFIIWISFILYALSFITWPFDPVHNLIYFFIVGAEGVLLGLIDRPGVWFLALLGLAAMLALNGWYNRRTLMRQQSFFASLAARALYEHMLAEQAADLRFAWAYAAAGILGALAVPLLEQAGLPDQLVWALASLGALAVPLVHVLSLLRLVRERSDLITAAQTAQA
jgi:hypothetical protein